MVGMRLGRNGRTLSLSCRTLRGVLVCLLTPLLKILHFILLLHTLWSGLALSLRNVRSCGCLKMIFGTRPHGHHPRSYSSVTSIPRFLHSTTSKRRYVSSLNHRLTYGLVLDRTLSHRLTSALVLASTTQPTH